VRQPQTIAVGKGEEGAKKPAASGKQVRGGGQLRRGQAREDEPEWE